MADAFFVALRLPNHFRAIFAEGAFNAAFVPAYARIREQGGAAARRLFADRVFTLLLASQIVLLAVALLFTPAVIDLLAPGFAQRSGALCARGRAHPHHLSLSAAGHAGDALRRHPQCAAAFRRRRRRADPAQSVDDGGAALAAFFPTAGHAAAWGVLHLRRAASCCWSAAMPGAPACCRHCAGRSSTPTCGSSSARSGRRPSARPACRSRCSPTPSSRASSPTGALSALYYADRLNQLPIGVIGIAAGTVVLPEMARRIAAGDEAGAAHAQNRAIELTLLLSVPCLAAFFVVPDLIMRALFMRGAFTDGRCGRRRADAGGLCDRAAAVRADPQRGRDILCPRRHRDAGEGRADRRRRQYRLQDFC